MLVRIDGQKPLIGRYGVAGNDTRGRLIASVRVLVKVSLADKHTNRPIIKYVALFSVTFVVPETTFTP